MASPFINNITSYK